MNESEAARNKMGGRKEDGEGKSNKGSERQRVTRKDGQQRGL